MSQYLFLFTVLSTLALSAWASEAPVLHDIEIEGSAGSPQLSIQDLKLELNREYLFVIKNPLPVSLEFQFEKLGQHVATRYLQGSPSVTQESVNVLPNSKVLWHFVTTTPGEFTIYIINPSLMQKGETRKIAIVDPLVQAELEKVAVIGAGKKAKPDYRGKIRR